MKRILIAVLALVTLVVLLVCYWLFAAPNTNLSKSTYINIPTGSSFEDVQQLLSEKQLLKSSFTFETVAKLKSYPQRVKPGHYTLTAGMNNRQIVNLLRAGLQTPVQLVIYNIRTKEEFASLVGRTLEMDSAQVMQHLNDAKFCKALKRDTANILSAFVMDNYEFYWTDDADKLFAKLKKASEVFWNSTRIQAAASLNLTRGEVVTLASIVERECMRDKELPTVAGVYLNRLRIGMPLQADPTLVFALRDFDARRVTGYHKEFESPYNTYLHTGLPPGPICMPRKKAIDAVLNADAHKYLYFCANPDMSGYSIFSESYEDQMRVAAMYRRKLNAMNIH